MYQKKKCVVLYPPGNIQSTEQFFINLLNLTDPCTNSDAIESMLYDHFSTKSTTVLDVTPTGSMSSSQISSFQKKFLPIATTTKSETTATLQSSNSSKFMSWMIPNKRTPTDLATDTASISSKKSSASTKDELVIKKFDIDVKKLYEYSTKDLHTFGYPQSAFNSPSDNNNINKIGIANTIIATTTTTATSVAITNGTGNSVSSTVAVSGTITSNSSTLDGNTGTSQKMKATEIFEKNGSTTKLVEKER